jgi:hypothetical protein
MQLRKLTLDDCPRIDQEIAKDPWHAGKGTSEFFFEPSTEAFVLSDDAGEVLNVRLARALRVNIVFSDPNARDRNKETMKQLAGWLREMAKSAGYREVTYTSENPLLRRFGRTVGFSEVPDMVMTVEPKSNQEGG